jgi:outer membrane protein
MTTRLFLLLTAALCCATTVRALNIDQAIRTALQHNPQLTSSTLLEGAAKADRAATRAPFWPTVELGYSYWRSDRDPNLDTSELSTATATARFNLFNGGSDRFRYAAAVANEEGATWQRRAVAADTVLQTRRSYIGALRAERNLESAEETLKLLQRQLRDTRLRLEQGLLARNDLLRVAVEAASAEQVVVSARGAVSVSRQALELAMGQTLDEGTPLEEIAAVRTRAVSYDELLPWMLEARSELHALNSRLAAQKAERKAVRGDLLPDVDLVLSYERFGNEALPEADDIDYDSDSRTLLQASWPIFSGFSTHYELAGRRQRILALQEDIRAVQDALSLQLRNALEDYKVAAANLETAARAVEQAEENYRVEESRYRAQVATTVDLLDAAQFLTRARNEAIKARYDLYQAEAVIDRVVEDPVGRGTRDESGKTPQQR